MAEAAATPTRAASVPARLEAIAKSAQLQAELKGSIGEGPNHSNHSNHSNSFKTGIFPRKFKNFRKFQHFLNYRRNSDKISSKSEQKSVERIQNNEYLQNFVIFEFFSLIFAQMLMKFCRNFADNLENVEKF